LLVPISQHKPATQSPDRSIKLSKTQIQEISESKQVP
jgi:hypothetical protein